MTSLSGALRDRRRLRDAVASTGQPKAIVLIGSFARGTAVQGVSDLDILVLAANPPEADGVVHPVAMSPARFVDRVAEGDDFAQWALRFGVPVVGRRWWRTLRESALPRAPWPDARRKLRQAAPRLAVSRELLAMGDADAAHYELRFALGLVARAILLAEGVFPLSRPELPEQLDRVGQSEFACWLRLLGQESVDSSVIEAALASAEANAADLDRRLDR